MASKDLLELVKKRQNLFIHYYNNFEKHLKLGNLPKSSEFVWGALHSLLYAIALFYDKKLSTHKQIIEFAKELSDIENDKEIYLGIKIGEELHANFYHDFLDKEGIEIKRELIDRVINKLNHILEIKIKDSLKEMIN
jgi:hypothetical protein